MNTKEQTSGDMQADGKSTKPTLIPKKMEQYRIEIRKTKLNEEFDAKRVQSIPAVQIDTVASLRGLSEQRKAELIKTYSKEFELIYRAGAFQDLTKIVRSIRQIVSIHQIACIAPVRESGIMQLLMNLLDFNSPMFYELISEVAWIISNVASGSTSDVELICKMKAIPKFIKLLNCPNETVREQAIWALANISGDECLDYRDEMLQSENNFLSIFELLRTFESYKPEARNEILWFISNLCRGKPYPQLEYVQEFVQPICNIILSSQEPNPDALMTIAYLTANDDLLINDIMSTGIGVLLVKLLLDPRPAILTPTLRAVAQICSGEDTQTELILEYGGLENLSKILDYNQPKYVREAIWAISNILAGPPEHVERVMNSDILGKLAGLMEHNPDVILNREVLYCFSHIASSATRQQIDTLVEEYKLIDRLVHFGRNAETPAARLLVLEGLDQIFRAGEFLTTREEMTANGESGNPYTKYLENIGGTKLLEEMQACEDERVYNRAYAMAERFFATESSTMS